MSSAMHLLVGYKSNATSIAYLAGNFILISFFFIHRRVSSLSGSFINERSVAEVFGLEISVPLHADWDLIHGGHGKVIIERQKYGLVAVTVG